MGLLFRRRRMKWTDTLGHDRKALEHYRPIGLACILIGGAILILTLRWNRIFIGQNDTFFKEQQSLHGPTRRLLATTTSNATDHSLPIWERCDEEVSTGIGPFFVFLYILLILVIFVALAIVCDDFFVPSLEAISEKLKLSEDVAGATFMAGGSSAPELFTSIAGVAFETDVGVGTIVGSAVFNILIIIALTAALAGQVLHLDWRPLLRDSFYYFLSICLFIYFSWDGLFHIWEACSLLVLYIIYIVLMAFNPRIMDWMASWRCICCKKGEVLPVDAEAGDGKSPDSTDGATEHTHVEHLANGGSHVNKDDKPRPIANGKLEPINGTNGLPPSYHNYISDYEYEQKRPITPDNHSDQHSSSDMPDVHYFRHQRGSIMGALDDKEESVDNTKDKPEKPQDEKSREGSTAEEDEEEEDETLNICPCLPCCPKIRTYPPSRGGSGCWESTKLFLRWVIFIVSFPFVVLFSWTIPDCSKDHNRKWFILSFIASVAWIMALSFGMVMLVGRTGCILNIDTFVMGLVIIAVGTSVPDALSSILVAREGYGDMAVSNAIGSNVFDINLGLGLPFVITIAVNKGTPINLLKGKDAAAWAQGLMVITPHAKFGFILLFILICCLTIFSIARFRLTKVIGISFVIMYVMFLTYAFVQEAVCDHNC